MQRIRNRVIRPGDKFGRMVVTREVEKSKHGRRRVECQCACGRVKVCELSHLITGHTSSCGCYGKEQTQKANTKHAKAMSSEYSSWCAMKTRCTNPKNPNYPYYGGRGIHVCEQWLDSFETFYADMGPKPDSKYEIERINNNGNYEPSNCRWATRKDQTNNYRQNRLITYNGRIQTVAQWSQETGIKYHTIISRLNRQFTPDKILSLTKLRKRGNK